MHELNYEWTIYGLHRPPSVKLVDYEKDLLKLGTFNTV